MRAPCLPRLCLMQACMACMVVPHAPQCHSPAIAPSKTTRHAHSTYIQQQHTPACHVTGSVTGSVTDSELHAQQLAVVTVLLQLAASRTWSKRYFRGKSPPADATRHTILHPLQPCITMSRLCLDAKVQNTPVILNLSNWLGPACGSGHRCSKC